MVGRECINALLTLMKRSKSSVAVLEKVDFARIMSEAGHFISGKLPASKEEHVLKCINLKPRN